MIRERFSHAITRRRALLTLAVSMIALNTGCSMYAEFRSDNRGASKGKTFYLGGAGPIGVWTGAESVPQGLRDAGYEGAIEVVGWQSNVGGTLRDQVDVWRAKRQGRQLAQRITEYLEDYPNRPVNLIGLSAGTGIIAWALEDLPHDCRIHEVVFLGSSLSRKFRLMHALERIDGGIWNFFSPNDPILRYVAPVTGSIDREFTWGEVAGLAGFSPPLEADVHVLRMYADQVHNVIWREEFSAYGYDGNHTDSVSAAFITAVVAPILMAEHDGATTDVDSRRSPPVNNSTPPSEAHDDAAGRETRDADAPPLIP